MQTVQAIRTFIALELPGEIREKLAQLQSMLNDGTSGVRWVRPAHMHLTLHFLGPTRSDRLEDIAGALDVATRNIQPFVFAVAGIGAFPNSNNPRVIWAGIQAPERLFAFKKQLAAGLASLGFSRDSRPFAPHLTLGRLRDGRGRKNLSGLLAAYGNETVGQAEASRVVFYRIDLTPAGPEYTILKDIELAYSSKPEEVTHE